MRMKRCAQNTGRDAASSGSRRNIHGGVTAPIAGGPGNIRRHLPCRSLILAIFVSLGYAVTSVYFLLDILVYAPDIPPPSLLEPKFGQILPLIMLTVFLFNVVEAEAGVPGGLSKRPTLESAREQKVRRRPSARSREASNTRLNKRTDTDSLEAGGTSRSGTLAKGFGAFGGSRKSKGKYGAVSRLQDGYATRYYRQS
ncbi:hypothetical protein LY76DRAFT_166217 [Colletotrichum caudatum]|nr:hypothetical protein LY76DRAFT_166217 [Colletotrichum caudatum]